MKCILLHGLGQTPSDWNHTVKNLDENFEVFCPTLFDWLQGTAFCYTNLYQGFEKYCDQFDVPLVKIQLLIQLLIIIISYIMIY